MTLSAGQIQELFDFTHKKYVHFYDLQSEIVDHLAAAIEDKINENRQLSFDQALDEVYKSFGIFGFAHIVREKEKHIDNQAKRMLWKEVLSLFTWPHLLLTLLVFILLYTITRVFPLQAVIVSTCVISLFYVAFCLYRMVKSPKPSRTLRMLNYYQPGISFLPYAYSQVLINFTTISGTAYISFTFLAFLYLVASNRVNTKIKSNAMAMYPEAFISAMNH